MTSSSGVIASLIASRTAASKGLIADRSDDVSVAVQGHRRSGLLLERLGNPQFDYKTIHIAGSKGKGTTAHLASAILTGFGKRTGLYTSPHLISWNERIRIDGAPISDELFRHVLERTEYEICMLEADGLGPFNAFELITAAAFLAFREADCDVAVVEVGLGGRFDSTNHLKPTATVITGIEAEHVDILGPDLETIAWNKAGIMQPGVKVVIQEQQPEVMEELIRLVQELDTRLPMEVQGSDAWNISREGRTVHFDLSGGAEQFALDFALPGLHNAANLGAAIMATSAWRSGDKRDYPIYEEIAATASIPGRFTLVNNPESGQVFVLDVAHTRQSIGHLVDSVAERFSPDPTTYVVSLAHDKPWHEILQGLLGHADRLVFPEASAIRAVPAATLAANAREAGFGNVEIMPVHEIPLLTREGGRPIVVTGSFGIVGETFRLLNARNPDVA